MKKSQYFVQIIQKRYRYRYLDIDISISQIRYEIVTIFYSDNPKDIQISISISIYLSTYIYPSIVPQEGEDIVGMQGQISG